MKLQQSRPLLKFVLSETLLLIVIHLKSLGCLAHREHKVHNIVLYPDKESWCKTTQIKQVVTWPSCNSQELDNNVCVGACFSYMVPHSEPSAPGDLIHPYCDSCQPLDSIWHTVTLECKDKEDNPTTMQKKVQIITNCSCSSCMKASRIKPDLNSLLQSLELGSVKKGQPAISKQMQGPQLSLITLSQPSTQSKATTPVNFSPSTKFSQELEEFLFFTSSVVPKEQDVTVASDVAESQLPESFSMSLSSKIVDLPSISQSLTIGSFTTIPSSEETTNVVRVSAKIPLPSDTIEDKTMSQQQEHFNDTPDLLLNPNLNLNTRINGSNGVSNADERFLQLFRHMNEPVLGEKLEMLQKLENLENLVKLKKLAADYPEGKELLSKISELLDKYSNQEEQQELLVKNDNTEQLPYDKSFLHLHPTVRISPQSALSGQQSKDTENEDVPSLQDQQRRVAESLMQRTGPHHSMVLEAGVKEKMEVESHYLHPALEGQDISYQDNVVVENTKEKKDF